MASSNVLNLDDTNFESTLQSLKVPVIVDFWAEWCGPCRMLGPILDQVADEQKDIIQVVKVNVDNAPATSEKFGVRSIPYIVYFKNGEAVANELGVKSKDHLVSKAKSL
jgi:thioredoxin 1